MGNVKQFLILFVLIYMVVAVSINTKLGPPGMSEEFLADYKLEYDHYIEISKNEHYILWTQRPNLVDFEAKENLHLQERIEFMQRFESMDAFKEEQHRRHLYDMVFDVFNAFMVVVLVTRFARKPLSALIDTTIETIRARINDTEEARQYAGKLLDEADHKIKGLPADLAGYEELAHERIELVRRHSALFTGESIAALNKETADRVSFEEVKAIQQVKERLVDAAIQQALDAFQDSNSAAHDDALIEQFVANIQERSV